MGFGPEQGKHNPCSDDHREKGIRSTVHGGDCISSGDKGVVEVV